MTGSSTGFPIHPYTSLVLVSYERCFQVMVSTFMRYISDFMISRSSCIEDETILTFNMFYLL